MTPALTQPKPTHLLSRRAKANGWNLFIFNTGIPSILCAGLNLYRHPFATSSTLYRWFGIVSECFSFHISPIVIDRLPGTVFGYYAQRTDEALPNEEQKLQPGDYDFYEGKTDTGTIGNGNDVSDKVHNTKEDGMTISTESLEQDWQLVSPIPPEVTHSDPISELQCRGPVEANKAMIMSEELKRKIKMRDKGCFITGISAPEAEMEVIWIIPPTMVFRINRSWWSEDYSKFTTSENAMLVCKNLAQYFVENRFDIDVDDDYRIVVFGDMLGVSLPSHLLQARTSLNTPGQPADIRLREHFKWTLKVNFCGGDIREDYKDSETRAVMEALGILGDGEEVASLDNPLWQTVLGGEILQAHMESAFSSYYESKEIDTS